MNGHYQSLDGNRATCLEEQLYRLIELRLGGIDLRDALEHGVH